MRSLALLLVIGVAGLAAQQQPVFRAGLVTIAVPTTVFDRAGELVTNLTREDFTVLDEGEPQEITNFVGGLQSISAVVLIDTSASMTSGLGLARAGAEQFLIRLRPGDRAKVGTFSSRIAFSGDFVEDRDQLIGYLRDLPFGNPTRLFDAIDEAITALLPLDGRRVVVPFTDGCDTASATRWDLVRARLRSEDIMIYPVQVRSRVRYPVTRSRQRGTDCQLQMDLELPASVSASDILRSNDPRRFLPSNQVIEALGAETGGGRLSLSGTDNMNPAFTRLMNELHYTYLIGFTARKLDGKAHTLQVKVSDKKMTARARRTYMAPSSK